VSAEGGLASSFGRCHNWPAQSADQTQKNLHKKSRLGPKKTLTTGTQQDYDRRLSTPSVAGRQEFTLLGVTLMTARLFSVAFVAGSLLLPILPSADAHAVVEPIGPITLGPVPGPGNEFVAFYPNEVDPDHPKILTWEGILRNLGTLPTQVDLFFDWLNPSSGQIEFGPIAMIPLGPGGTFSDPITYTIPYCPPEVSIHINNAGQSPVFVQGTFTHECLHGELPEPSMLWIVPVLAVMAPWTVRRVKALAGR
jgi:hypothetical protein